MYSLTTSHTAPSAAVISRAFFPAIPSPSSSVTLAQRLRLMCSCFPGYTRHTEIRFEPASSLHPTPPLAPATRCYNIDADSALGLATARPVTRGGAGDRVSNLRREQQPASPLVRWRRQRQSMPAAAVMLCPLTRYHRTDLSRTSVRGREAG
jgi:hypothetical protein